MALDGHINCSQRIVNHLSKLMYGFIALEGLTRWLAGEFCTYISPVTRTVAYSSTMRRYTQLQYIVGEKIKLFKRLIPYFVFYVVILT